jgi:hypothetical protein
MSAVIPGRFTASTEQPFVVFLIGMRVNRFRSFRKWWAVANAMPPMIETLLRHPEKGCLGAESFFRVWPLTTIMVSYWRSFEDLERFARSKDEPHLEGWRNFNKLVGNDGTVGIWHETYLVPAGQYEAVYGNMPVFGLAKATEHVPAVGRRETARRRLGGENEPGVSTAA